MGVFGADTMVGIMSSKSHSESLSSLELELELVGADVVSAGVAGEGVVSAGVTGWRGCRYRVNCRNMWVVSQFDGVD